MICLVSMNEYVNTGSHNEEKQPPAVGRDGRYHDMNAIKAFRTEASSSPIKRARSGSKVLIDEGSNLGKFDKSSRKPRKASMKPLRLGKITDFVSIFKLTFSGTSVVMLEMIL